MTAIIKPEHFGKDHAQTLMFVEVRCVDFGGSMEWGSRQMRRFRLGDRNYPTRLQGGIECDDVTHDDWSCLQDFVAAGILEPFNETSDGRKVKLALTNLGWNLAGQLRRNRAIGILDADFDWHYRVLDPELR